MIILANKNILEFKNMDDLKKKSAVETGDKDIIFSKSIKAGKRIYYLDVKKNRKDEMFLAITESKKMLVGSGDDVQVNFEKHKIFLYREDFAKFTEGLQQVINYINREQGEYSKENQEEKNEGEETKKTEEFDISF